MAKLTEKEPTGSIYIIIWHFMGQSEYYKEVITADTAIEATAIFAKKSYHLQKVKGADRHLDRIHYPGSEVPKADMKLPVFNEAE